VLNPYVLL